MVFVSCRKPERIFAMNFNQKKDLKSAMEQVRVINSLEERIRNFEPEDFQNATRNFKLRLSRGETHRDILPEAFAVCREASRRVLGMRHFDVQLIGGITLDRGDIAEMMTGEGKTLSATTAAYLNALDGKGVHVVTVNDYLARRDAETMAPLFSYLGMTTGCILSGMEPDARRAAYAGDVTYGTANEFGFDYLRDNMADDRKGQVQRDLHYAIIDEVDSVLIDEARTPLIISGPDPSRSEDDYLKADEFVKGLSADDYEIQWKERQVSLTEQGVSKAENYYSLGNLSDPENMEICHYVLQALRANLIMARNIDYIVKEKEVFIVDEFTGRVMEGRRFSDGLHQAIEAKERVTIMPENRTLAMITLQNYFRMYRKLSGMTGTARTEADEFREIYNMNVLTVPTNRPVKRIDCPDQVFISEKAKWEAVVDLIEKTSRRGQPVLAGTTSVENSEYLSILLRKKHIVHTVLNARNDRKEAEIIAQAGRFGAVTVATNMAGRGTDILLGGNPDFLIKSVSSRKNLTSADKRKLVQYCKKQRQRVMELGGLLVIGTERHESRRIDDQLRGRAGRQGDPGKSVFYVSMEDQLLQRFSRDEAVKISAKHSSEEKGPVSSRLITALIENTQKKVEGNNYAIRKNVLNYDDVLNQQRKILYSQRQRVLEDEDIQNQVEEMIGETVEALVKKMTSRSRFPEEWDFQGLAEDLGHAFKNIRIVVPETEEDKMKFTEESVTDKLIRFLINNYRARKNAGSQVFSMVEKKILITVIDRCWTDHLEQMEVMRKGIGLMALGQKDPVTEYARNGKRLFELKKSRERNLRE